MSTKKGSITEKFQSGRNSSFGLTYENIYAQLLLKDWLNEEQGSSTCLVRRTQCWTCISKDWNELCFRNMTYFIYFFNHTWQKFAWSLFQKCLQNSSGSVGRCWSGWNDPAGRGLTCYLLSFARIVNIVHQVYTVHLMFCNLCLFQKYGCNNY